MAGTVNNRKQVVVVGAGIGGLTAAADLAVRGWRVTLVERHAQVGGKMRQLAVGPAQIAAGPTVLTLRDVFDDLFAQAGESLDEHVQLQPLDVLARHAWPDGSQLDLYADARRSAQAIAELAGPAEALGFEKFLSYARGIWQTVEGPFVRGQRPTPLSILRSHGLRAAPMLARIDSRRSMWQALGGFFADRRLRQLFGRYATYTGCSPFLAPATLNLVAWVEASGVWQVQGGIWNLAGALLGLMQRHGGVLRCGQGVARILTDGGRASGVELEDGEILRADAVVFGGDASALATGLLGPAVSRAVAGVEPEGRSLSALTWCLHTQTSGFALHHHNVFFGPDYPEEFEAILRRSELPETPTVYVCAQDRGEGQQPQGPERLLVLVNAPAVGDRRGGVPEAELRACQERTWRHLEALGLTLHADGAAVRTGPAEFEGLFPASGGALYGAANHSWSASLQRPGAQTQVPGLYLVGGTAHPGAGVPMAALSGRLAAQALAGD